MPPATKAALLDIVDLLEQHGWAAPPGLARPPAPSWGDPGGLAQESPPASGDVVPGLATSGVADPERLILAIARLIEATRNAGVTVSLPAEGEAEAKAGEAVVGESRELVQDPRPR